MGISLDKSKMRRQLAGPGTNKSKSGPQLDAGKCAPAAHTSGYRRTTTAAGPTSQEAKVVVSGNDAGKQAAAGNTGAGYRINTTGNAAGPTSQDSKVVVSGNDAGKQAAAGNTGAGYRVNTTGNAAGPTS